MEEIKEPNNSKLTVLVVEDDQSFREFLNLLLSKKGFKVLTAESPEMAMGTTWITSKIDLAYIDVNYENTPVTGFDLAEAIKKVKGADFPFMIMSMNDNLKNHRLSKQVGALGFAEKNFECLNESIKYAKEILNNFTETTSNVSHHVFSSSVSNFKPSHSGTHLKG